MAGFDSVNERELVDLSAGITAGEPDSAGPVCDWLAEHGVTWQDLVISYAGNPPEYRSPICWELLAGWAKEMEGKPDLAEEIREAVVLAASDYDHWQDHNRDYLPYHTHGLEIAHKAFMTYGRRLKHAVLSALTATIAKSADVAFSYRVLHRTGAAEVVQYHLRNCLARAGLDWRPGHWECIFWDQRMAEKMPRLSISEHYGFLRRSSSDLALESPFVDYRQLEQAEFAGLGGFYLADYGMWRLEPGEDERGHFKVRVTRTCESKHWIAPEFRQWRYGQWDQARADQRLQLLESVILRWAYGFTGARLPRQV